MSKHTPGPWMVDRTVALGAYGVWTDPQGEADHKMRMVCSVYGMNELDLPREERDANALLMAAAPDLLEALEGMKVGVCWCELNYSGTGHSVRCCRVREALSKAKGEV